MGLGVTPRPHTKKHMFRRDWTTCSKDHKYSKLNRQLNLGGPTQPINEHFKLHFDNEQDIRTSSYNYEESDYTLDLELLTVTY
jgi:hypothetical protein